MATTLYAVSATKTNFTITLADKREFRFEFDRLTPELLNRAAAHGFKQKIVDAAAIPRDITTGRSASDADKLNAMAEVATRLLTTGEWNTRNGEGGNEGGLLLRALVELYPTKTREALTEWLKKKSKSEQAALRADAKVAPIIARLRAESAPEMDTSAMLDELAD